VLRRRNQCSGSNANDFYNKIGTLSSSTAVQQSPAAS
jgi:hypothetical protein